MARWITADKNNFCAGTESIALTRFCRLQGGSPQEHNCYADMRTLSLDKKYYPHFHSPRIDIKPTSRFAVKEVVLAKVAANGRSGSQRLHNNHDDHEFLECIKVRYGMQVF